MKYMGSKGRLARYLLPIILESRDDNQWYVEPFVGGANLIDKVTGARIGADYNKYLIAMWHKLQSGWNPPDFISKGTYDKCRNQFRGKEDNGYSDGGIGYVGFNGSYSGRFYDGGYAGKTVTKQGKERNYPLEAYNNIINQVPDIMDVEFVCCDYKDLDIPPNSIVYCDPPYKDTKAYIAAKESGYCSDEFWEWCRQLTLQGHKVFISEYQAPEDFTCVWEKGFTSSLRANGVIQGSSTSVERLFVYQEGEQ